MPTYPAARALLTQPAVVCTTAPPPSTMLNAACIDQRILCFVLKAPRRTVDTESSDLGAALVGVEQPAAAVCGGGAREESSSKSELTWTERSSSGWCPAGGVDLVIGVWCDPARRA